MGSWCTWWNNSREITNGSKVYFEVKLPFPHFFFCCLYSLSSSFRRLGFHERWIDENRPRRSRPASTVFFPRLKLVYEQKEGCMQPHAFTPHCGHHHCSMISSLLRNKPMDNLRSAATRAHLNCVSVPTPRFCSSWITACLAAAINPDKRSGSKVAKVSNVLNTALWNRSKSIEL